MKNPGRDNVNVECWLALQISGVSYHVSSNSFVLSFDIDCQCAPRLTGPAALLCSLPRAGMTVSVQRHSWLGKLPEERNSAICVITNLKYNTVLHTHLELNSVKQVFCFVLCCVVVVDL